MKRKRPSRGYSGKKYTRIPSNEGKKLTIPEELTSGGFTRIVEKTDNSCKPTIERFTGNIPLKLRCLSVVFTGRNSRNYFVRRLELSNLNKDVRHIRFTLEGKRGLRIWDTTGVVFEELRKNPYVASIK